MKQDSVIKPMSILFALFCVLVLCIHWYRSYVQAELYKREGIDITTWECFIGCKPAERAVRIRE